MKKLKSILSSLCLVVVLGLVMAPATTVHADTDPQGGTISGTPHPPPPPPPPPPKHDDPFSWIICWLLG